MELICLVLLSLSCSTIFFDFLEFFQCSRVTVFLFVLSFLLQTSLFGTYQFHTVAIVTFYFTCESLVVCLASMEWYESLCQKPSKDFIFGKMLVFRPWCIQISGDPLLWISFSKFSRSNSSLKSVLYCLWLNTHSSPLGPISTFLSTFRSSLVTLLQWIAGFRAKVVEHHLSSLFFSLLIEVELTPFLFFFSYFF